MKLKWFKVLGLFGFIGLAGLFTGNPGFYGFFGFFAFLGLAGQRGDELLEMNLGRAGIRGFVLSTAGLALTIAIVAWTRSFAVAVLGLGITFFVQTVGFALFLTLYERGGS